MHGPLDIGDSHIAELGHPLGQVCTRNRCDQIEIYDARLAQPVAVVELHLGVESAYVTRDRRHGDPISELVATVPGQKQDHMRLSGTSWRWRSPRPPDLAAIQSDSPS